MEIKPPHEFATNNLSEFDIIFVTFFLWKKEILQADKPFRKLD